MEEKTQGQLLKEQLCWNIPNIAKDNKDEVAKAQKFCEGYKDFLNKGKTERECVEYSVDLLVKAGYKPFDRNKKYKAGDKVYFVNREKAVIATTFGQRPLTEGSRLNFAHIDAPRLDLKPNPLYEKSDISYLKTHYYGGIRKYQWTCIPLAIHGVVCKADGTKVKVCIGEEPGDPVFVITDLLPHLAAEQGKRTLNDGIKGEELNIITGCLPFDEKDIKEPVKLMTLKLLNEKYGIVEKDFVRAEIEIVPATKATDVGLDRGFVGAAGQDDRVCGYTALMAEIDTKTPVYTTITALVDKEEIGSVGNTGLNSDFILHYIEFLAQNAGVDYKDVCANALCMSSDVNAAFDPTFPSVHEPMNASYAGKGCVITKYTGSRGKSGSNDASAEVMQKIVAMMDEEKVYWQIGELGAIDVGGGGTVAAYVAHMNIDVVDVGVPILSMHSPFELAAKVDVYNAYRAYLAFFKH